MDLMKPRDRDRLTHQLTEGSQQARHEAARRALPLLKRSLDYLRDAKAGARARFESLIEAAGQSEPRSLAINPLAQRKAATYRLWAPIILVVEALLAAYTASLTIAGSWVLHLVAGVVATALFTGLAKLGVSAMVDGGRTGASSLRLERQLRIVVLVAAVLLGGFFLARFFAFAEVAFALVSTGLSFAVAYLAALCLTLAELLGASNREVERYSRIARVEAELVRLHRIAARLEEEDARQPPPDMPPEGVGVESLAHHRRAGLTAALIVAALAAWLILASATASRLEGKTLHLWIDVSGSVAAQEFDRVRTVLADPMPLLDAVDATAITLTPFWAEHHALFGATSIWRIPAASATPACTDAGTVFSATKAAREQRCAREQLEAQERWQAAIDEALAPFRTALAGIDVATDRPTTCLYPVLDRVIASRSVFHLVLTDGAHANCGLPPDTPRSPASSAGAICGAVILLPDHGGEGLAARMATRDATLRRLYPSLVILPSWQIVDSTAWDGLLTPGGK